MSDAPLTDIQKQMLAHLMVEHGGRFSIRALSECADGSKLPMPFSVISLRSLASKGMIEDYGDRHFVVTQKGIDHEENKNAS